jgi:predicted dehydrogenase
MKPTGEFKQVLGHFLEQSVAACVVYQDYRHMLESEPLDAVIIATPDHHHVLAAMLALHAGLDVYLEKPISVSIMEGRLLASLVQRTGRILQVGSQQRTMEMNQFGCQFILNGGLGKISHVQLANFPGPMRLPSLSSEEIPPGMEWDLFCGPTRGIPYNRKVWIKDEFKEGSLLWRGWDLWRDFSGHMMTNWGAHSIDMVQYALGQDTSGPVEVAPREPLSTDSYWEDWKEKTPAPSDPVDARRFWPVTMKYDNGVELQFDSGPDRIVFHGEKGSLQMRRNFFSVEPSDLVRNPPPAEVLDKWQGNGHVARPHLQNWIDCIRSRQVPNAPVEVGHRTASICHLANIARELNRTLRWNPQAEQFVADEEANNYLQRPRRPGFELPI